MRTVHTSRTVVNTLLTVVQRDDDDPRAAAGQRFKRYLLERFAATGGEGGVTGLERQSGVKRQQMHQWFTGAIEPQLGSLLKLAETLGVTRATLLAALDGQLPPPDWQAELEDRVTRGLRQVLAEEGLVLQRGEPASRQAPARRRSA